MHVDIKKKEKEKEKREKKRTKNNHQTFEASRLHHSSSP
jgi:hypothetical protein